MQQCVSEEAHLVLLQKGVSEKKHILEYETDGVNESACGKKSGIVH